jgi:intracellular sulfur oxidation DsrE/DsrF family protein
MSLTRKSFIATTAFAAGAAALSKGDGAHGAPMSSARAPIHYHILGKSEYDYGWMTSVINSGSAHKQVFESVNALGIAPGIASIFIHMQNSMNAYEFSYGLGRGSLATLAVFIGPSVVFALNNAMWKKYQIGSAFKLDPTNTYYAANSNLDLSASPDDPNGIYQDWSAQAVAKRGGVFMVCHNATTAVSGMFAMKMGKQPQAVLADWSANLLPGFKFVPAGVAAVQLAQDNGWKLYTVI